MGLTVAQPSDTDAVSSVSFSRSEIIIELDRVSRTALGRKKALQKMLRFVVEATLDDKGGSLKEYTIATLVFGKGDSFDPRMTSLVRTQAHKLREALVAHYSSNPRPTGPWLWIPAGSYRAVFHHNPGREPYSCSCAERIETSDTSTPLFHIAAPVLFPRESDLTAVARAIVHAQRKDGAWDKQWSVTSAASSGRNEHGSGHPNSLPLSEFEIKQTIVELEGGLLLTSYLLGGRSRSILFGRSCFVEWDGNSVAAISRMEPHLSEFIRSCCSLVSLHFASSSNGRCSETNRAVCAISSERDDISWQRVGSYADAIPAQASSLLLADSAPRSSVLVERP